MIDMPKRLRRRRRQDIHRRTKPGAQPGMVRSAPDAHPTAINLISYGPHEVREKKQASIKDLQSSKSSLKVNWVDITGLSDAPQIEEIGKIFGLHRLALEDVVNVHQRAKVEEFGDKLFVVVRMPLIDDGFHTEQLSLFVGDGFVITFQERDGDCLEPVRRRIRQKLGRIRTLGADYLAYAVIDAVIDAYYPILERYGDSLEMLEDEVLDEPEDDTVDAIHSARRDLLLLRRAIGPHREALAMLALETTPVVTEPTRIYLRDCSDHIAHILDLVTVYRGLTGDLRDLYMSSVNNRINETMRVLTIIATIFIPLTFICGLYGMNFKNMPELRWHYGYYFSIGLMVTTAACMLAFFRFRRWL